MSLARALSGALLSLAIAWSTSAHADIPPSAPDGGQLSAEELAAWQAQKSAWYAEMQAKRAEAKRGGCSGREALLGGVAGGALVLAASAMRRRRRAATA